MSSTHREQLGLTQNAYAQLLGVTQAYVSMLERHRRPLSPKLTAKLSTLFAADPTKLPLNLLPQQCDDQTLAHTLGRLGYPGFSHLQNAPLCNPAQLLLECLRKSNLDVRVAEGLPWLLSHFEQLDTLWLVSQAKQGNLQNRLGFLTALANEVTPKPHLRQLVGELEPARLAAEQTLSNQPMPQLLRDWMRQERTPLAAHWNLLTKLDPATISRSMKSRSQ